MRRVGKEHWYNTHLNAVRLLFVLQMWGKAGSCVTFIHLANNPSRISTTLEIYKPRSLVPKE